MHVAIIDGDVAYPANSGKRLRTLNLMLPLAKNFRISYLCRAETFAAAREASAFLAEHGIEPICIHVPLPGKKGPQFYTRLAVNLLSSLPYSVASHTSKVMRSAVARFETENAVDLWQLEWSGYRYTIADKDRPVVLQAHNVDALIWQRYWEAEKNILKRRYIKEQLRKFRRFEGDAFRAATRVVAVSEADASLAQDNYGILPIEVVDNGVNTGTFATIRPDRNARTILFLGALDWMPNLDALTVLLDSIFPLVRASVPDARLTIAGRRPPSWLVSRVEAIEGATLAADVPDVKPYLANSSVMTVPLRIGGGSRIKILEALAAGLPVVSTSVGTEGLKLGHGRELTIADDPGEAAAALVDCLANPDRAFEQAERGRRLVGSLYDWKPLADRLGEIWERTISEHPLSA